MRVFHGTDVRSAIDILTNGWQDTERIWPQSNLHYVYFWADAFNPDIDLYESVDELHKALVQNALESGYLAAVKSNTSTIVALEYEVPDDLVQRDNSQDTMIDSGAGQVDIIDAHKAVLQNVHICQLPARLMLLFLDNYLIDYDINLGLTEAEYYFVQSNRTDSVDIFNEFLYDYYTCRAESALAQLNNLNSQSII